MRVVYDTEFIDDGITIEPLSIGMLDENGAELYAVFDSLPTVARAVSNDWLRANVLPHLPITIKPVNDHEDSIGWDPHHPDYRHVKPHAEIAEMVEDFVKAQPHVELWAYYAAYDHVLYAQLYGPMSELPDGLPMFTNDIKQEATRLGETDLPGLSNAIVEKRFDGVRRPHHALYDAYEEREQLAWLADHAKANAV